MSSLSFEDVVIDVKALSNIILEQEDGFDFVVGVARGGWIPARLLSSALGVKKLISIGVTYQDAERSKLVPYSTPNPMPLGKRLLIVEDCLETGSSLEYAQKYFAEAGSRVRTAALYVTERTRFVPDFSLRKYPVPPTFPWEI